MLVSLSQSSPRVQLANAAKISGNQLLRVLELIVSVEIYSSKLCKCSVNGATPIIPAAVSLKFWTILIS